MSSLAAAAYSLSLRTHSIASGRQVLQSLSIKHSSEAHACSVSFPHVLFSSVSQLFSQLFRSESEKDSQNSKFEIEFKINNKLVNLSEKG